MTPPVAEALRAERSLEGLESIEGGKGFLSALDDYLDEFGHRATGELDLSRPRWREGLLDAGEMVVAEGQLDRTEDVWFLRKDELFAALAGESPGVDLASRRAEFESHAS